MAARRAHRGAPPPLLRRDRTPLPHRDRTNPRLHPAIPRRRRRRKPRRPPTPERTAPTPDAGTSSGHAPEHRRSPRRPARSAAQAGHGCEYPRGSTGPLHRHAKPATADKPGAPALDLSALEQRLKDTRAIGVFTKLSLKNQVDDLLARFRAFHQGSTKSAPPADLRHQYDSLIVKVLALLQNDDPQLASAISSSREAIWGVLADPEKFSKI